MNKDQITGHALETLTDFLQYAQNAEFQNNDIGEKIEQAKTDLLELINKLRLNIIDFECQIEEAQTIIKGIEYVENYIIKGDK